MPRAKEDIIGRLWFSGKKIESVPFDSTVHKSEKIKQVTISKVVFEQSLESFPEVGEPSECMSNVVMRKMVLWYKYALVEKARQVAKETIRMDPPTLTKLLL